jgi:Zn-dependent M16 (insulinase) family peptidase
LHLTRIWLREKRKWRPCSCKRKSQLTEAEAKKIIKQSKDLEKYLKSVETQDLSCLPKMTLDDVPVLARKFALKREKYDHFETFHHDCFTNHIVYADICLDLPKIEEEELPYMQLLLSILPKVGCGKRDYVQNLEYLQAHTGGVSVTSSLHVQATNSKY